MRMRLRLAIASCVLTAAVGCGDDSGPAGPGADGPRVYEQPLSDGNTFACATCHALSEPAPDGLRRPGHPIGDATRRPSYKDGRVTDLLVAVNTCVTEWMNAPALAPDDSRWIALQAYLDSQATVEVAPALDIQIVAPPADPSGGNATTGRDVFNGTCAVCHGSDATGTRRAPALTGSPLDLDYIAQRVRTSGREDSPTYDGLTGGRMPFWGLDRLSDEELRDVAAYVAARSMEAPMPMDDAGTPVDAGMPSDAGTPMGCASTHARVGQTATFITRFHRVAGTARIVDDCTIVIENFTYDGTGIDVRIYGGLGGDYGRGFAMSEDLLRAGGYDDETLRLTLPAGRTLDELDGLSVWCVDVGVSFGDGMFP